MGNRLTGLATIAVYLDRLFQLYSYKVRATLGRLRGNSLVRHVRCTYLGKTLPYLAAGHLLFPLGFVYPYNIPYYLSIKLPIYILYLY